MALIKCKECGNEVSDSARRCPKCGAKPRESNWWLIPVSLLIILPLLVVFLSKSDPKSEEKQQARDAIKLCWDEYERKSLAPNEKRFIASACEMMENKFEKKYGSRP